jgi:predicted AlkP superfamily pyrophosphatase or phosphodiesterase
MRAILLVLLSAIHLAAQKQVVVIGVDGLGGQMVSGMPKLQELMRRGVWTLHARGVIPTVSSPNWASMISGTGPEQHGVTSNEWQPDKFEIASNCRQTIFGVLRTQRPASRIAVFHDWDGFSRLVEKDAAGIMEHRKGSTAATKAAIEYWNQHRPTLMFLHLDNVDHAGHEFGWGSPEYEKAKVAVDDLIGRVTDTVGPQTMVLVTADHGGVGKKHGGLTMAEIEIPWIVAGPGVAKDREIKTPVNTYDTAATIAHVLGLRAPECWIGRAQRLK